MLPEPPLRVPEGPLARRFTWIGIGVGAALFVAVLIATQNWLALAQAGEPERWPWIFVMELPVWLAWAAVAPLILQFVRHFPIAGRHRLRNLALHLPFALFIELLAFLLHSVVRFNLDPSVPAAWSYWDVVSVGYRRTFGLFLLVYGGIVAVYQAFAYYRAYQARSVAESRLEAELAHAELRTLRMQLHPHFLFNTLHVISALMSRDVPTARRMMRRLSELLRLTLETDSAHEVSLEEELEILDHYVEIQRMRFQENLTVTYEVSPQARAQAVPALLLQPLVENAILHGVARVARPGQVVVRGQVEGGRLRIAVEDNGPGLAPQAADDRGRGGLGIRNTMARLSRLYGPGAARFSLRERPEGGTIAELRLPARAAEASSMRARADE
jgi:signal transduction histidine kinase